MDNLTLLEHEVLDVLKKIEYCCESAELRDSKTFNERKFLEIFYTDKNRPALESELISMDNIEKYLQKNGIDFRLTYNFIDEPERTDGFINLGKIYGDSIQDIKSKIKTLISKIKNQKSLPNNINITYNINIGRFIFNGDSIVDVVGKQKDVSDCLVEAGKDIKISWDEIFDKFKESVDDQDIVSGIELDKRKRSVRTAVTEINSRTKKFFNSEKELIDVKENNYWLQYEVEKGR